MLIVDRLNAFDDNYIWILRYPDNNHCVVVDPGDAAPVISHLQANNLFLEAILITHKHGDHIGGIKALKEHTQCTVIGPANDGINNLEKVHQEGDREQLPHSGIQYQVLDVPGHTLGHIAYLIDDSLFCGDTLFVAGCGRVFEGTMQQMHDSLTKLANLPVTTKVYCAHEYTLASLSFALTVDPANTELKNYYEQAKEIRASGNSTVPSTIGQEKEINPFLRCHKKGIIASASKYEGRQLTDPVSVFSSIRQWKNSF